MATYEQIAEQVIKGDLGSIESTTNAMLAAGEKPVDIINKGLVAGMTEVGNQFQEGNMFVPEVLMSAKVMDKSLAILKPLMAGENVASKGKVVMATVEGDLHDIGKRLCCIMMESNNFEVVDLGKDVKTDAIVAKVKEVQPDVLGMSAMLTTTMYNMKKTIDQLKEDGLRDSVKIIVGGAPCSDSFSDEIGADGFSTDAMGSVELAGSFK